MSMLHIRCVPECEHQEEPLYLNECGSCLYHKECCPIWCRCGTKTKLTEKIAPDKCLYPSCTSKRASDTNLLCKKHLETLDAFILGKLKILGSLKSSTFSEIIMYHSNQTAKGDIAFLASHDVQNIVDRQWKAIYSGDGSELVNFSVVVNKYASENSVSVNDAITALNLPQAAYGLIMEDARLLRHNWKLNPDRIPVPQSAAKIFDKQTMMTKLLTMTKPTIEIEKLVCFFPQAASTVVQLLEEKKIAAIDNGRLVCVNSPPLFCEDLRSYWMEHVESLE